MLSEPERTHNIHAGGWVRRLPDPLLPLGAMLARLDRETVETLARLLLATEEGDEPEQPEQAEQARSTLNNDGSPLQLCLSSSHARRTIRLIGDPTALMRASAYADGAARMRRARQATCRLLRSAGCDALLPAAAYSWETLLPRAYAGADNQSRLSGPLWLAAGLGAASAAVYLNARWGAIDEQWERIIACLRGLLPSDAAVRSLATITPYACPASLALEGSHPGDARVKVYWRLRHSTPLTALGCPLLVEPALAAFLLTTAGTRLMRLSGLVFALGFSLADGELQDVKLDLCAHCLPRPAGAWLDLVARLTAANGLVDLIDPSVEHALRGGEVEVALLGFGVDRRGARRLNLYLKAARP